MAVSLKGRRKLMVRNRRFVWWVCDSRDRYLELNVGSDDGAFFVRYHLGQPAESRFLDIIGREFPGRAGAGHRSRIRCAEWQKGASIGPGDVRRLVDWCFNEDKQLSWVDGDGNAIGSQSS
jgi:hypothetical protein